MKIRQRIDPPRWTAPLAITKKQPEKISGFERIRTVVPRGVSHNLLQVTGQNTTSAPSRILHFNVDQIDYVANLGSKLESGNREINDNTVQSIRHFFRQLDRIFQVWICNGRSVFCRDFVAVVEFRVLIYVFFNSYLSHHLFIFYTACQRDQQQIRVAKPNYKRQKVSVCIKIFVMIKQMWTQTPKD